MLNRIARKVALIEASLDRDTFPTKSAQKEALAACQSVMSELHQSLQATLLAERAEGSHDFRTPAALTQYYWSEGCHKWNAKVEAIFADRPEFVEAAREVVGKYLTIKAKPVVAPTREQAIEQKVERYIGDLLKNAQARVNEEVRLMDLFKRLSVGASWHYVTNAYGTTFRRFAYYLNGQRTALGIILASLEQAERDGILEIVDGAYQFANTGA